MVGIDTWHLVRYLRSTTAVYGPDPQTLLTCKVTDQGTPNLTINAALLTLRSLPPSGSHQLGLLVVDHSNVHNRYW
jgi:hypothetical protein